MAVITGEGSDFGRLVALEFARRAARVEALRAAGQDRDAGQDSNGGLGCEDGAGPDGAQSGEG